jgi:hypothetical protein
MRRLTVDVDGHAPCFSRIRVLALKTTPWLRGHTWGPGRRLDLAHSRSRQVVDALVKTDTPPLAAFFGEKVLVPDLWSCCFPVCCPLLADAGTGLVKEPLRLGTFLEDRVADDGQAPCYCVSRMRRLTVGVDGHAPCQFLSSMRWLTVGVDGHAPCYFVSSMRRLTVDVAGHAPC